MGTMNTRKNLWTCSLWQNPNPKMRKMNNITWLFHINTETKANPKEAETEIPLLLLLPEVNGRALVKECIGLLMMTMKMKVLKHPNRKTVTKRTLNLSAVGIVTIVKELEIVVVVITKKPVVTIR